MSRKWNQKSSGGSWAGHLRATLQDSQSPIPAVPADLHFQSFVCPQAQQVLEPESVFLRRFADAPGARARRAGLGGCSMLWGHLLQPGVHVLLC